MKTKSLYVHNNDNKNWLIYPDNKLIQAWDLFMVIVLLISIVCTPLEIAFSIAPVSKYSS